MFEKILIANRGEIACRIIKSAKKMGIKTVAVFSDADKEALHVQMADEAINIGAPPAGESYLNIDKIIDACKKTKAQAVHPGYGFLSENAQFCAALKDNNIVFIGPNSEAIKAMGDKITSKKIAKQAGVSIIPGFMGLIKDKQMAVKIAKEITYPVMIKASAGGGGKGMRIAYNEKEVIEGFERAKSEAASSFGDDRIFIEKFIEQPRHIEIQLLGDNFGNIIYLGERECSIQRRNQKVIEEAPSSFVDEKLRKAMGEQAVMLAKAVNYCSAGTVEFIVDKERHFYFLEMNTRLQVEHPISEMICNIDLVEQMIRVAAGEKLALKQKDIKINGWAIESRIYAEDPRRNFLPSTGRLIYYRPPKEQTSKNLVIRNDSGVYEGAQISPYYDPMIAKLCTWAPNRKKAISAMSEALGEFIIEGVGHNIDFLQTIMEQEHFQNGDISTNYIAEHFPDGFSGAKLKKEDFDKIICAIALMQYRQEQRDGQIEDNKAEWVIFISDKEINIKTERLDNSWKVEFEDKKFHIKDFIWCFGEQLIRVNFDEGKWEILKVKREGVNFIINFKGAQIKAKILRSNIANYMKYMPKKEGADMSKYLLCPMPGQIINIDVKEGDIVEAGQALVIVEAMKMENVLYAAKRARIKKVHFSVGDILSVDEVIMEFEAVTG